MDDKGKTSQKELGPEVRQDLDNIRRWLGENFTEQELGEHSRVGIGTVFIPKDTSLINAGLRVIDQLDLPNIEDHRQVNLGGTLIVMDEDLGPFLQVTSGGSMFLPQIQIIGEISPETVIYLARKGWEAEFGIDEIPEKSSAKLEAGIALGYVAI